MSPPRIARSGDPFDRALLRAGRNDDPPRGAEDRAFAALGLSAELAPGSVGARPGSFSAVSWGASLKVIAVLLALGACGAGVWMGARWLALGHAGSGLLAQVSGPASARTPSPASVASASVARPPEPIDSPLRDPVMPSSPRVPPDDSMHSPARATPTRPVAASGGATLSGEVAASSGAAASSPARRVGPGAVDGSALSVEITLVQDAARALASGDAAGALRVLDRYDRKWPHGALAEEAGALRVQALQRTDRAAEARTLARKLLDAHPHGVLAARLQRVLDGSTDAAAR